MHEVEILDSINELKIMVLALADQFGELRAEIAKVAAVKAAPATTPPTKTLDFAAITDQEFLKNKCDKKVFHKKVRGWDGDSFAGTLMSECPPDYLEKLADQAQYFAEQAAINGTMDTNPRTGVSTSQSENLRWYVKSARGWAIYNRKNSDLHLPF